MRVVSVLLASLIGTGGFGLLAAPGPPRIIGRRGARSATLKNLEEKKAHNSWPRPHPLLLLGDLLPPPVGFPDEFYTAAVMYNAVYLAFLIFYPNSITDVASAGEIVAAAFAAVKVIDDLREDNDKKPENRARRSLNRAHAPPKADPWAGPSSTGTVVVDFVEKNRNGQTLVLEDPSGTVKTQLLDNMYRGRMRVLAPAMEELRLSKDISKEWGYDTDKAKGLGVIAEAIGEVVEPSRLSIEYPPKRLPVIALIDVPSDATKDVVTIILRDVKTLKEKAGGNIIPVVCLAKDYGLNKLPLTLAFFQIERISF